MISEPSPTQTRVACVPAKIQAGAFDVTVSGPLILSTTPLLNAVLTSALDCGARRIAVDLRDVSDFDTAGLAALVVAARRLRACHGTLTLVALSPDCEALMERFHLFAMERTECSPRLPHHLSPPANRSGQPQAVLP